MHNVNSFLDKRMKRMENLGLILAKSEHSGLATSHMINCYVIDAD